MSDMITKEELEGRIQRLYAEVNKTDSSWDAVFITDKFNQYYLTGTMQDGLFILQNDGSYAYFVRSSYERARQESPIANIYPMAGYKDAAAKLNGRFERVYVETEIMTCAMLERIRKYFPLSDIVPLGRLIGRVRSIKTPYELSLQEEAGRLQKQLLESVVPGLLSEGMNEAELSIAIYQSMIRLGHHGVIRFAKFQTDMFIGHICFGENSLYPTSFDGPGGMRGMGPYAPFVGSRERLLKKGDLVFVDLCFGINGYHTDRTQLYLFGAKPSKEMETIHEDCLNTQRRVASMLKPGQAPAMIYNTIMNSLDDTFLQNFMGFGSRSVKFLGHGVGLHVDEYPVIANGFDEPLEENMTLAVEPKKGLAGVGLLGAEDTYVVTKNGGRCLTGGEKGIITVM